VCALLEMLTDTLRHGRLALPSLVPTGRYMSSAELGDALSVEAGLWSLSSTRIADRLLSLPPSLLTGSRAPPPGTGQDH